MLDRIESYVCILLGVGFFFVGCLRDNQVVIDLPAGENQIVVESYLEPDSVYRVSLTRTQPYFEIPTQEELLRLLVTDALVTISHDGQTDTLTYYPPIKFDPDIKPADGLFYKTGEYRSKRVVKHTTMPYTLNVKVDTTEIYGTTYILPPVELDSMYVLFNNKEKAAIRVRLKDPDPGRLNYFRFVADDGRADSLSHFVFSDRLLDTEQGLISTSYRFERGDTVNMKVYHISEAYYNFYRSVSNAISSNYNPLSEPGTIKSNISGNALGIFTGITQTNRMVIIPK